MSQINSYIKDDFQVVFAIVMFRGTPCSIKLIEKLSRRHLINSSDVFVIKGFTVHHVYNSLVKLQNLETMPYTVQKRGRIEITSPDILKLNPRLS